MSTVGFAAALGGAGVDVHGDYYYFTNYQYCKIYKDKILKL